MTTTTTDTVAETLISVGFSFFVAGVNDGSTGALLPYVIREHGISTAIVSSVYGANFAGWFSAAVANAHLCSHLDLGATLALGAACQVAAHGLRAWDPPFGLGTRWRRASPGAHRWLAAIHAAYMAGCLAGPFAATAVAAVSRWHLFYAFPLAVGVANLALVLVAFRDSLRLKADRDRDGDTRPSRSGEAWRLIRATAATPSVWFLCAFFFFYLGSVLTASGWVVEYLVDVRRGSLSQVGYVPAGFNGGALLGRLLLAEPTHRFGERGMVFVYCLVSTALQLVFWLVPNIIAASIAVSFIGFFTGPLFATGISLGSKLFPRHIHSTALALVFVSAQMGGSLFPVITGVVSSNAGVQVLQPILVGLLAATPISWLCVPRPKDSAHAGLHQE
ncbi:Major facilitator superfamily domain, general substrate transporter [Metarhizium guizhouense ARSEF 977]|uniref:Major facilitator superfamily domain, general substrate transporter n=1 Tax=Metarhizium guizhouense (strain ARSEF 977) TaxID=1276136 RepID=A0A0B4GXU6_METGA|nr:Major facilitator superfamily domain, general substrate transporter [Metarhizium guizhouense ARSEF 977]